MTIVCEECGGAMRYVLGEEGKQLQCTECGHIQTVPEKSKQAQTAYSKFKKQVKKQYQATNETSTTINKKNSEKSCK